MCKIEKCLVPSEKLVGQAAIYPVYLCSLADLFSKGSDLLLHLYWVVNLYPLIGIGSTRTGSDIERGQPAQPESGPLTVW
jgi:hypothetical protein